MGVVAKQAVVFVHGIGESKPMATLLSFVGDFDDGASGSTLRKDDGIDLGRPWSPSPDDASQRYDLRKIGVEFSDPDELADAAMLTEPPPIAPYTRETHFYEYYWAYRFRGTRWNQVVSWVRSLVMTPRCRLHAQRLVGRTGRWYRAWGYLAITVAFLAVVAAALLTLVAPFTQGGERPWTTSWERLAGAGAGAVLLALVLTIYALWLEMGVLTAVRVMVVFVSTVAVAFVWTEAMRWDRSPIPIRHEWLPDPFLQHASTRPGAYLVLGALAFGMFWLIVVWHNPRFYAQLLCGVGFGVASVVLTVLSLRAGTTGGLRLVASILLAFVGIFAASRVLGGVGDAARYLSSKPDDVQERQAIRGKLVELLEHLHDEADPGTGRHTYERIVVVGHSLGAVIAYDALNVLWFTRNKKLALPPLSTGDDGLMGGQATAPAEPLARAAAAMETTSVLGVGLSQVFPHGKPPPCEENFDRRTFRRLQDVLGTALAADERGYVPRDADAEPRSGCCEGKGPGGGAGGRWIVSDFVTVGAALAPIEVLVANSNKDVVWRQRRRLLTSCPPRRMTGLTAGEPRLRLRYKRADGVEHSILHHAATFATTRWTNLYFRHDLVGGPLVPFLGRGVHDVELSSLRWAGRARPTISVSSFLLRYPHSGYWKEPRLLARKTNQPGHDEAQRRLRSLVARDAPVAVFALPGDAATADLARRAFLLWCATNGLEEHDPSPEEPPCDTTLAAEAICAEVRLLATGPRSHWVWAGRGTVLVPMTQLIDLRNALRDAASQSIELSLGRSGYLEVDPQPRILEA